MKRLLTAVVLCTGIHLPAQDAPAPAPPPPIPDNVVFTLKKPTKYEMPKPVQGIIAVCLDQVPAQAAVWREEYANIFEDKEDVRKWIVQKLHVVMSVKSSEFDAREGDIEMQKLSLADMQWVNQASAYIKTGW